MAGGVKADVRTYQMYVNGELVDSNRGRTFPVYDPPRKRSSRKFLTPIRRCESRGRRGKGRI